MENLKTHLKLFKTFEFCIISHVAMPKENEIINLSREYDNMEES